MTGTEDDALFVSAKGGHGAMTSGERYGLFELGDFFVFQMFAASTTVLGESQFFWSIGLVSLCNVVKMTTFGAFQT